MKFAPARPLTRVNSGCTILAMSKLSNQEKSARRYEALTKVAEKTAKENDAFQEFLKQKGNVDPTWRRLETFIKNMVEQGKEIRIVIDSSVSGD